MIASMTEQNLHRAMNGGPLTLELYESVIAREDGAQKVGQHVKCFIERGGHQLQLNIANREMLLDAQVYPEKYRHLIVRIWGWSAYFVELNKCCQDHVIAKQEYRL